MEAKTFTLTDSNREQVWDACSHNINGYVATLYKKRYKSGRIYCNASITQSELGAQIVADDMHCFLYDSEGNENKCPVKYTIQTTSYGALPIDEIEKVMRKLQVAIDTVKWLEAYDWNTAPFIENIDY